MFENFHSFKIWQNKVVKEFLFLAILKLILNRFKKYGFLGKKHESKKHHQCVCNRSTEDEFTKS